MKRFFLHVILTMLVGGLIYLLFRSSDLLMFRWFEVLKLDRTIHWIREYFYEYRRFIPASVLYSLPDALWIYSFTMYLSFYFRNIVIILIPAVGSLLVEICQLWFVPGTFDIIDVLYMTSATMIAVYFIYKNRDKKVLLEKSS